MARNKDVYLQSSGGRWVRYDAAGHIWSRARITATVLDITSTTAPVLSIRGGRLPYLVITSDPLQERLVTKSNLGGIVPFAFLEIVSPLEWVRRTRTHVRLASCFGLRESPIMSRPIRRIWLLTA